MSLPWDRFEPDESPTPPTDSGIIPPDQIPSIPPTIGNPPPPSTPAVVNKAPNMPVQQGDWNFKDLLAEAFSTALRDAGPQIKGMAQDYAKETVGAVVSGKQVDWGHPNVTAETSRGKELVVADAKNRSWRTLLQGLGIDLLVAICAVLVTVTGTADLMEKETWILLGALLIKTIIQTVVAYFMRLRVTPTIHEKGDKLALVPVPEPVAEKVRRNYQ